MKQPDVRALFGSLVRTLHEETAALIAGDADRVAALSLHKDDVLQRLAPLVRSGGEGLPRDLVEQARVINDRNALLLAPRLTTTRARLDALRRAGNPMLYGSDGRTQSFAQA